MVNQTEQYDHVLQGRGHTYKQRGNYEPGEYPMLRNVEINSDGALQERRPIRAVPFVAGGAAGDGVGSRSIFGKDIIGRVGQNVIVANNTNDVDGFGQLVVPPFGATKAGVTQRVQAMWGRRELEARLTANKYFDSGVSTAGTIYTLPVFCFSYGGRVYWLTYSVALGYTGGSTTYDSAYLHVTVSNSGVDITDVSTIPFASTTTTLAYARSMRSNSGSGYVSSTNGGRMPLFKNAFMFKDRLWVLLDDQLLYSSGLNPANWTMGAGQAGLIWFYDGGMNQAVGLGNAVYLVADNNVQVLSYTNDPTNVADANLRTLSDNIGGDSLCVIGDNIYFANDNYLYVISSGTVQKVRDLNLQKDNNPEIFIKNRWKIVPYGEYLVMFSKYNIAPTSSVATSYRNYMSQSSFESGTADYSTPSGWTKREYVDPYAGANGFRVVPNGWANGSVANARTGSKAINFSYSEPVSNGVRADGGIVYYDNACTDSIAGFSCAGKPWTWSFYATNMYNGYPYPAKVQAQINFYNSSGALLSYSLGSIVDLAGYNSGDYRNVFVTATAPAGTTRILVQMNLKPPMNHGASGPDSDDYIASCIVDDIMLEQSSTVNPYYDGSYTVTAGGAVDPNAPSIYYDLYAPTQYNQFINMFTKSDSKTLDDLSHGAPSVFFYNTALDTFHAFDSDARGYISDIYFNPANESNSGHQQLFFKYSEFAWESVSGKYRLYDFYYTMPLTNQTNDEQASQDYVAYLSAGDIQSPSTPTYSNRYSGIPADMELWIDVDGTEFYTKKFRNMLIEGEFGKDMSMVVAYDNSNYVNVANPVVLSDQAVPTAWPNKQGQPVRVPLNQKARMMVARIWKPKNKRVQALGNDAASPFTITELSVTVTPTSRGPKNRTMRTTE